MKSLQFSLIALAPLLACGPSVEQTQGEETSPCNAGLCLQGLECRSDLCVDPDREPTGTSGPGGTSGSTDSEGESGGPTPTEPSDEIDILFVVDNSGSMGEEQANLSESIADILDPLTAAGKSVRVAITTTDDGNYWCGGAGVSDPESGHFVASSCRSRLGDFFFIGNNTDAETVCTDFCDLESVVVEPTTTAQDAGATPRPWIEIGPEGTNLPENVSAAQALQCWLPQGINGCGFESTLETTSKALTLMQVEDQDEFGFLREGAHLAIVFVTDEADCSFNRDLQDTVFGEEGVGNQVFWSLPDTQQSPSSAVCWNAGVDCDFSAASAQCVSADKNVEGGPAGAASDAALYPVAQYRDQLTTLRQAKLPFGAEVFTFGIVGVPEGYGQTQPIVYAQGADGTNPGSFQAKFGIGQGCSSTVAEAVPPVRLRELIQDSDWSAQSKLYSVCNVNYTPALQDIARTLTEYRP